MVNTSSGGSRI